MKQCQESECVTFVAFGGIGAILSLTSRSLVYVMVQTYPHNYMSNYVLVVKQENNKQNKRIKKKYLLISKEIHILVKQINGFNVKILIPAYYFIQFYVFR